MLTAFVIAGALAAPASCSHAWTIALNHAKTDRVVRAYVDPIGSDTLATVLELRRWAANRPKAVRVELVLAQRPEFRTAADNRVGQWISAMTRVHRLLPALRLVAQEGVEQVATRVRSAAGRTTLARQFGLNPHNDDAHLSDPCTRHALEQGTAQLARDANALDHGTTTLPIFRIGDQLIEDDATLAHVRAALGSHAYARRRRSLEAEAAPSPQAHSARMRRPHLGGLLLGGRGLPHHFVLMLRDEDDPSLLSLLPPVLAYRNEVSAQLSIRLVARGQTLAAKRLRHRLCAAHRTGEVVAYVEYLATERSHRESLANIELLARLDQIAERHCESDPDPFDLGLPDGAWLDGLPQNRAELESLATTLARMGAASRPLSRFLTRHAQGSS